MSNLIHDRTTVYNIGYHIVWSVKYRKDVLTGKVEKSLKQILIDIANEKEFIIGEMEIMSDHVHLFVSAKPKYSPGYIYKMLKGISGRRLFIKYPGLKKKLYKGHLWNSSTYIETVGHISEDTIEKYILDQKKK
jgi:putative transposase